jgi:malate/lactate dehydrogenase
VGAGNVGVAAAYAMFIKQTAGELILIDQDGYRAEGEAMDLMHGCWEKPLTPPRCRACSSASAMPPIT